MKEINTFELFLRVMVFISILSIGIAIFLLASFYPIVCGIIAIVALIQMYIEQLVKTMLERNIKRAIRIVEFTYITGFAVVSAILLYNNGTWRF